MTPIIMDPLSSVGGNGGVIMQAVKIGTQSWGVLQDGAGNALMNRSASLTDPDGNAAVHYATAEFTDPQTGPLVSNANGTLPRFIEDGTYTLTIGAETFAVEAVRGGLEAPVLTRGVLVRHVGAVDYAPIVNALIAEIGPDWPLEFEGDKTYLFGSEMTVSGAGKRVKWSSSGQGQARLVSTITFGNPFTFEGELVDTVTLTANAAVGRRQITVDDASMVEVDYLAAILSNKAWYHDPRAQLGYIALHTGTAQAGAASTITLAASAPTAELYTDHIITITGGTGVGQESTIIAYNGGTKVATVVSPWAVQPNATSTYSIGVNGHLGQADAGGASTITLDEQSAHSTLDPVGDTITIRDGTGAGQARNITGYVPATRVATVHRAWTTNPDSTSFYVIPQCFKGELHRVRKVTGAVLDLHSPLWDGYDVVNNAYGDAFEDAVVQIINPVQVELANLSIEWQRTASSTLELVKVKYGTRAKVHGCTILNGRQVGVQFERCYDCHVEDTDVVGCDGFYTGYGVASHSSSHIWTRRSRFAECKKGMDFHSTYDWVTPWPSRGGGFRDNLVVGGGVREDGAAWGPVGVLSSTEFTIDPDDSTEAINFGSGSHGAADGAQYIDNTYIDVHCPFFLRGRNETIKGNKAYGRMDYFGKVWFGGNHVFEDNEYRFAPIVGDDALADFYTEYRSFDAEEWNQFTPFNFIDIIGAHGSYAPTRRGHVEITGNRVRSLRANFLYYGIGGGTELSDVTLRDNHIELWATDGADEVKLVESNNSATLYNFVDIDNTIVTRDGTFQRYRDQLVIDQATCKIKPAGDAQTVSNTNNVATAITTEIAENTTPLSTSGTEVLLTGAITPTYKGSRMVVRAQLSVSRETAAGVVMVSVFRKNTVTLVSTCIGAKRVLVPTAEEPVSVALEVADDHQSFRPLTYSVRVGGRFGSSTGTNTVNLNMDAAGAQSLGGKEFASLVVQEVC